MEGRLSQGTWLICAASKVPLMKICTGVVSQQGLVRTARSWKLPATPL